MAAGAHPDAVTMMYEQFPVLEPKDISDAVIYSLGTPGRVQVILYFYSQTNLSNCIFLFNN